MPVPGGVAVRFRLRQEGGDDEGTVAERPRVTLDKGAEALAAGVLQVVAGGWWPIACRIAS